MTHSTRPPFTALPRWQVLLRWRQVLRTLMAFCVILLAGGPAHATSAPGSERPAALQQALVDVFDGSYSARRAAIDTLTNDPTEGPGLLRALADGRLVRLKNGRINTADPADHAALTDHATSAERPRLNNRLRQLIAAAAGRLALVAGTPSERRAALDSAFRAPGSLNDRMLSAAIQAARSTPTPDPAFVEALFELQALHAVATRSGPGWTDGSAAARLAHSSRSEVRAVLRASAADATLSAELRQGVSRALDTYTTRHARADQANAVFSGLSAASILLLAALGLAITYGLMGVINMAHGELLMVGAYATWGTQEFMRALAPALLDAYLLLALPLAFTAAAALGMLIEWLVLRHLYGKPVDSLLATFGISLILMQTCRTLFGAQNVEVANPTWLQGAAMPLQDWLPGLQLLWSRLAVLGFALVVLALVWIILQRTRLGLFVRAVTQNRRMAACTGVRTRRIDSLTFGLGSGIAGLGGCALSQIGNVGPDLGQTHIIDSFMVVVLGGVGQLAGTLLAAAGLGVGGKLAEPLLGAVLTKIVLLVLIILFIQRRPQGIFAQRGRMAEV